MVVNTCDAQKRKLRLKLSRTKITLFPGTYKTSLTPILILVRDALCTKLVVCLAVADLELS
jgi:hypothetical protein